MARGQQRHSSIEEVLGAKMGRHMLSLVCSPAIYWIMASTANDWFTVIHSHNKFDNRWGECKFYELVGEMLLRKDLAIAARHLRQSTDGVGAEEDSRPVRILMDPDLKFKVTKAEDRFRPNLLMKYKSTCAYSLYLIADSITACTDGTGAIGLSCSVHMLITFTVCWNKSKEKEWISDFQKILVVF